MKVYPHRENTHAVKYTFQVMYQGQIIGAIIAETRTEAQRAATAVVVEYEELSPIFTIQVTQCSLHVNVHTFYGGYFNKGNSLLEMILQERCHKMKGGCHVFM